ncbi:SGNH/GDSL hydrolase family protein [Actinomadura alba]|uniref:SGNH/GDSL hydrolase family protein n=1 Tax=Actinomadura alba TaxID=406431 RepID=A0ABR7LVR2_9ACTN|nr:SGNH/GDSL hydrolase family protein [Actinomadura alba]MBC6468851.1 SGNH/GDSL hydrolase family protein [Actinomadura alba]
MTRGGHTLERRRRWVGAALALLTVSGLLNTGQARAEPAPASAAAPPARWVASWTTAMAVPVSGQPLEGFTDTTLRQRIHLSIGGTEVRLRLTNVYGRTPLVVRSASLARPGAEPGDVDVASLVPVTFAGSTTVTLPAGAEFVSDPIRISVPDDGDLLASLYLPGPTGPATFHRTAHSTGFVATGDRTSDPTVGSYPNRTTSFWFLDGLDVRTRADGAVAFLGDSITDGDRSTLDADHRWTDYLADRMLAGPAPHRFGVANAGIAGNRLLLDHSSFGGVNALARLERDVLTQTGVHAVFVFEGVNDIQSSPSQYDPAQIVGAYRQIIQRAHDRGLRVIGATIGPFQGWPTWTPEREAVRVTVNEWIRTSGEFDGLVDFDAVLRDPAQPQRMRAAYDSGDHLHPKDAGYAAMAAAVDLRLLRP